ncbi:hypothetical protein ACFRDV_43015 [Streptomyces fagopyri]|uniref:hypothetical protein n=1 Tax=Streptomyces fagopyri TaxID=2662397 RepID=UPI0036C2FAAC
MSFIREFKPTQLTLVEESPVMWRVTFDNPPVNVIGPDLMRELKELLTELENNDTVNVVVFDSANPEFFLAHYAWRQTRRSPRPCPARQGTRRGWTSSSGSPSSAP